ncbi:hypothetical protein ACKI2N_008010 [Cupriavidus sp. 30B13]|uniref:hypothetical protein n=1 Tax=Cupriavidus sp. 30B13 TaxID=3384241 RepID=UPI003B8EC41F
MPSIVAGRFPSVPAAEKVALELYARGFSVWDVSVMSVAAGGSRPAGVLLAVQVEGARRDDALDVLRRGGACGLEQATGQWEHGRWADFDPRGQPRPAEGDERADVADAADAAGAPGAAREPAGPAPGNAPVAQQAVALDSTFNEDPGSELEHYVDKQRASRE